MTLDTFIAEEERHFLHEIEFVYFAIPCVDDSVIRQIDAYGTVEKRYRNSNKGSPLSACSS